MKKFTLLSLVTLFLFSTANAQISKGSLFIGGSFGGSSSTSKDDMAPNYESKTTGFSILPQIGKAIGTNKIVGLSLGYGFSSNESNFNNQKQDYRLYSAGVFYRRYYPLSSRFYLFGQADLQWAHRKDKLEQQNILQQTANYNGINFNITPGISYAASRKLHLEASLNSLLGAGYQTGKSKVYNTNGSVANTTSQKNFYLAGNGNGFSNITIGLRWILPSKK